jgi:DNA-binding transcriptional LysR family regulator
LNIVDAHPVEGLEMVRSGHVDIALIFRNAGTREDEAEGFRLTHLLDDPLYLLSDQPGQRVEDHRDSAWVGGCERCRAATITACERAGFVPRIAYSCDDTVITQALVAAGMGVAIVNGLALRAHRAEGVHATRLSGNARQIYAATYGDPPDPPATSALIETLIAVAESVAQRRP